MMERGLTNNRLMKYQSAVDLGFAASDLLVKQQKIEYFLQAVNLITIVTAN